MPEVKKTILMAYVGRRINNKSAKQFWRVLEGAPADQDKEYCWGKTALPGAAIGGLYWFDANVTDGAITGLFKGTGRYLEHMGTDDQVNEWRTRDQLAAQRAADLAAERKAKADPELDEAIAVLARRLSTIRNSYYAAAWVRWVRERIHAEACKL